MRTVSLLLAAALLTLPVAASAAHAPASPSKKPHPRMVKHAKVKTKRAKTQHANRDHALMQPKWS
jgi:hypothetical protein